MVAAYMIRMKGIQMINKRYNDTIAVPTATDISSAIATDISSAIATELSDTYFVSSNPLFSHYNGEISGDSAVSLTGPITFDTGVRLAGDAELLENRLIRIEKSLGISTRYPTLEGKYPELHAAGDNMDRVINRTPPATPLEVAGCGGRYTQLAGECEIMEKLKLNNEPD